MADKRIAVGGIALAMTGLGMVLMYLLTFEQTVKMEIQSSPMEDNVIQGTFNKKQA